MPFGTDAEPLRRIGRWPSSGSRSAYEMRYTVEARSHIKAIYHYLAERNPIAALEIVSRIRGAAELPQDFPESGGLESILERPSGSCGVRRTSLSTKSTWIRMSKGRELISAQP